MKRNFLLTIIASLLFTLTGIAQSSGNYVSATLTAGSTSSSVYVTFMSNTTLANSKFSTFQFAVAIPASVTPAPALNVTSLDPLITYAPVQVSTETGGSTSFTVYSFSGDGAQSGSGTTYTTGSPYNIAEVFFTGGGS